MRNRLEMTRRTEAEFLADLDPRAVEVILASAHTQHIAAKHAIMTVGQQAEHLYMLQAGQARYFRIVPTGTEVSLRVLAEGDVFGLAALLKHDGAYMANTETVTDCDLLVWTKARIRALAAKNPQLVENALRIALSYLRGYVERHLNLLSKTAEQRLALTLLDLGHRIGHVRPQGIEIETTNEQLGSLADTTRFTTSRLLKTFQRAGAVSKKRGRVVIHTPETLAFG